MPDTRADERRPSRREVLAWSARLALLSPFAAVPGSRLFAAGETAVDEPWARFEELGPDLWAVISKPLGEKPDYRTLCNGGLVAGKERVLAVEGFARPDGAAWVGETALELTGRWPTDVVVTHFHGDHANGLAGFVAEGKERPRVWMTAETLELVKKSDADRGGEPDATRAELLGGVTVLDPGQPTDLDLGGRTVRLHPRGGHTPSDVTVELDEPSLVFFGDLVWNQMFPNYRDAIPTELSKSVRAVVRKRPTVYVPGHGPLSDQAAVGEFLVLIDDVEEKARAAFGKGMTAEEAAKTYQLPESVREWHRFQETYFEVAMRAWHRELGSAEG
jgi:glyoxylase-like metal-dependent hydrolase (beta-lactamase superfamily II)